MEKKKISIIGLGLIGGSIAKALKKSELSYIVESYDKKEVLKKALSEKTIEFALDSIESSANSDFIFLCLPTEISLEVLGKLAPLISSSTVITDVCGMKGIFENKWKKLNSKGIYIGGHPMTGKEANGYINSDPLLFENAVYIISSSAEKNERLNELVNIVEHFGARVRFLDPFLHDKVIARVSHLPQLLSVALVNSTFQDGDEVNYLDFAAGGFRDMTRIASSDFDIWKAICKLNREEIITSIEVIHQNLTQIEDLLEGGAIDNLEVLFHQARERRDEIPKNTKGFINPLFDVFVYVKDEPGVLSNLTTLLYKNNINIKDIELLKIREGTGGTFRISFDSEKNANKARLLIEQSGFATR